MRCKDDLGGAFTIVVGNGCAGHLIQPLRSQRDYDQGEGKIEIYSETLKARYRKKEAYIMYHALTGNREIGTTVATLASLM